MRSLLDINVVIALLDPDHDFHRRAHAWWANHRDEGWASCPLTENGVVRVMANPAYNSRRTLTPAAIANLLRTFTRSTNHEFWPDALSTLDEAVIDYEQVLGPRQITDLYLLALAASRGGLLATFDESVHVGAVRNAGDEHLSVI
jgi:toxin-antitoxin system PIN domain toxin